MVVVGKHFGQVLTISNVAILVVQEWLSAAVLALAEYKMEAILVSSRRVRETMMISVGDHIIKSKVSPENAWHCHASCLIKVAPLNRDGSC